MLFTDCFRSYRVNEDKNPPIPAYAGTCFTSGANKGKPP